MRQATADNMCRSFLSVWPKDENKFYGRANIGVCTINLPDVAFSSNGDKDKFWRLLDERAEMCHTVHKIRANRIANTQAKVAPILWCDGALARLNPEDTLGKLVYSGYLTASLGMAGLYECTKYMTGESLSGQKGNAFGKQVMNFLNKKCEEWKAEDGIAYSQYGTPLESSTYTFAKSLRKRFGKVKGVTDDRDYITNSYHIPVFEHIDAFSKLSIESGFQSLCQGG